MTYDLRSQADAVRCVALEERDHLKVLRNITGKSDARPPEALALKATKVQQLEAAADTFELLAAHPEKVAEFLAHLPRRPNQEAASGE